MRRHAEVSSLRQCLQRMVDRCARAYPEHDAAAIRAAVGDLNPDVIVVCIDACDVQQPLMKTEPHATLIQRAEPSIHNIRVTTILAARPLFRHAAVLFHKECQLWRAIGVVT